jgi:acetylornithine deacetylase/succinyl-diaminopimelate desuccinylase-like protein
MDTTAARQLIGRMWDDSIIPKLVEYIRIPNRSPLYDPEWRSRGFMDQAVELIGDWCAAQPIPGLRVETVRLEGRTPVIFMEIPGDSEDCVLLYGHLDKQPEMTGWREGFGPWNPVIEDDRLYGRGGADDGYAAFASLAAVMALQAQRLPHARCVVIIEACEESGSYDLPYYIDHLADRIGTPSLIVCLDSGCGNYDQLWCTASLRGLIAGDLVVELLREGVHSGDGSGVVAESFRIVRQLLSRLEDESTGIVRPAELWVDIPPQRKSQAEAVARILGAEVYDKFPLHPGVRPVSRDLTELVLNRTWRPALAITGQAGLPLLEDAGNVLRPMTAVKISLRVPPSLDARKASEFLKTLLETDPPYGARVRFDCGQYAQGWSAPPLTEWLGRAVSAASREYFGAEALFMGEGGSIPFMAMLGRRYPDAEYLITGVLGPNSNAHGPNEFLHIPTGKKITGCVAGVLAAHFRRG